MTAHDKKFLSSRTPGPTRHPAIPVTRASRDTAAVIIWRISPDRDADADTTGNPDAGDNPLTERLARHLVAIYSDVHGHSHRLRRRPEPSGRGRGNRAYATRRSPTSAKRPRKPSCPGPATLILLRWPRQLPPSRIGRQQPSPGAANGTSRTTAAPSSSSPPPPTGAGGASYRDHEQVLLPAARAAGLRHLHDIVPIDAIDGRDAFTYATDQRSAPAGRGRRTASGRRPRPWWSSVTRPATVTPRVSGDRKPAPGATGTAARSCHP